VNDLYESDIVLWSGQQADLLRRLARGERVNELDWENVIEEIESVGRSQIASVRSLLRRALEHLLKAAAWPQAPSARKWLHEANAFLIDAQEAWAPSMRQHIDLEDLYRKTLEQTRDLEFEEGPPGLLPETCPVGFDELLASKARHLIARFRPPG
jgi:hypothetical protein